MAREVQQVSEEVDRAHHRGEEAADARAKENVASPATPLGSEGCADHANGALAVEAEEADGAQAQLRLLPERGLFMLTVTSSVGHPNDVIIPVM